MCFFFLSAILIWQFERNGPRNFGGRRVIVGRFLISKNGWPFEWMEG